MKIIIKESQLKHLTEAPKKANLPEDERAQIVTNAVIKFMEHYKLDAIPGYRFLTTIKTKDLLGFNMKYFLYQYVNEGEFDKFREKIIELRPEFTYPTDQKLGSNRFKVDTYVSVKSMGEVIVYNTFKMNGIKLKYEDPDHFFYFIKDFEGKRQPAEKHPDFYWEETDSVIEVAGLTDIKEFGMDYKSNLIQAQEEFWKTGSEMFILDYYSYKDNYQQFYKYVCETFGFPYEPDDFWLSVKHVGVNKEEIERKVIELLAKKEKKRGERYHLNKYVTTYMTQPQDPEKPMAKPVGYKDVKHYKRETGIGLKFGKPELRKMAQTAWCKSSGGNLEMYRKFKELYGETETLSKNSIERMKKVFPQEFDMSKRDEICNKITS